MTSSSDPDRPDPAPSAQPGPEVPGSEVMAQLREIAAGQHPELATPESAVPHGRDLGPDAAEAEQAAREIVLRKLTAQDRSRQELAKALAQKEVPDDVADSVLDRMEAVGLVDDAALAESWVRSRQSRRYLSKRALRQELVRKGIEAEQIDQALDQVEPDDEYDAAVALAQKKLRSMSGLEHQVKYRRLAGALSRRGFSAGVTSRVLSEVLSD